MFSFAPAIYLKNNLYLVPGAPEGPHFFRFFAQDKSGNVGFCDFDVKVIGEYSYDFRGDIQIILATIVVDLPYGNDFVLIVCYFTSHNLLNKVYQMQYGITSRI